MLSSEVVVGLTCLDSGRARRATPLEQATSELVGGRQIAAGDQSDEEERGEREMLDLEAGIVHVVTRLRSVIR